MFWVVPIFIFWYTLLTMLTTEQSKVFKAMIEAFETLPPFCDMEDPLYRMNQVLKAMLQVKAVRDLFDSWEDE